MSVVRFLLDALILRAFQFASESHQHVCAVIKTTSNRGVAHLITNLSTLGFDQESCWRGTRRSLTASKFGGIGYKTTEEGTEGGITLARDASVGYVSPGTCGLPGGGC